MDSGYKVDLKDKPSDWIYLLVLIFPLVLIYFRVIAGKTFFWDDALYLWYPYRHFAADALSGRNLPLWNPYLLGGAPFQADIQSSIFYPFNLILTPFIFHGKLSSRILQMVTIFHVYLGGVFMFYLMKKVLKHKFASFFSALTFIMLPQIVYRSLQPVVLHSMVWLPLLFLIVYHLFERRSWLLVAAGAAVVSLNLFSGFPHYAFMNMALVSLFILFRVIRLFINKKTGEGLNLLVKVVVMFVLGAGIFSVQLLPTMEFTELTTRTEWSYNLATDVSFHPLRVINIFVSKFFGGVSGIKSDFWLKSPYYTFWEMAVYFGILPILFAIYGAFRSKSSTTRFFAFMAVLSFWVALGKYGGIYYLVYLTPVFHRFRCPARFIYIFNFSMIVLAGYGLRSLINGDIDDGLKRKIFYLFMIISVLIFLFILGVFKPAFAGRQDFFIARKYSMISLAIILISSFIFYKFKEIKKIKILPFLVCGVLLLDLFMADFSVFEGKNKPEAYFRKNRVLNYFLSNNDEYFRINSRMKGGPMLLPRSIGCIYRLYTLQGLMPLRLLNYLEIKDNVNEDTRLKLYNTKYTAGIRNNRTAWVEVKDYLPRVKIYTDYMVVKNDEEVYRILNSGDFDFSDKIILNESPGIEPFNDKQNGTARITEFTTDSIIVNVKTEKGGILFLSEHQYPGWKAVEDERKTEIIKAFGGFRAVELTPGHHRVKFKFLPHSFVMGRIITFVSAGLTFILFLFSFLFYRKKPSS